MTKDKDFPATDSAAELHNLIGDDSTATFESDPKFEDSNPGDNGSSENIEEQRDTDDLEDSDEEEEDDEQELVAAALRADGLLGQEDEQDDIREKHDRLAGDTARAGTGSVGVKEEDDDGGDVETGVDEDALDEDDMDTDQVAAEMAAVVGRNNASYDSMRGI